MDDIHISTLDMDDLLATLKAAIHALHTAQMNEPVLSTDLPLMLRTINILEAFDKLEERVQVLRRTGGSEEPRMTELH